MFILSIIQLLLSNAVTLWRDKSILYSRVSIIFYSSLFFFKKFYLTSLILRLFGWLFHAININSHIYNSFISIRALILQLSTFYLIKVWTTNIIF